MAWKVIIIITVVLALAVFFGFRLYGISLPASLLQFSEHSPTSAFPPITVSFRDVRAVYATASSVSLPSRLKTLINLIKRTELNALVVDIKDTDGVYLGANMERIVTELRTEGIYPIARMIAFQDNDLAARRPDLALHTASGTLWTSGRGKYRWVDPASREVWDYNVGIARRALDFGFAEVNFDYIRFPSDGDTEDPVYPVYDGVRYKVDVMAEFFHYLTSEIKKTNPNAILSADLFAYSFLRDDGLGVGQRLENAAAEFDVVSPMIYPSHFANGNFGFDNPNKHPYEVVRQTLESGRILLGNSTTTAVIRPWLQDFSLSGVSYGPVEVRTEILAAIDGGSPNTWMMWNPSNIYNPITFLLK
ncbi:MAG: putative glycoside hydrolase [Candidatus Jorgensenbacteria bacterium]|nr:putative glycoside hydrolase [Candidatus Jorgensenbacteria bacterium]